MLLLLDLLSSEFIVEWLDHYGTRETRGRPSPLITAQTISSAFIGRGLRWIRGQRTRPAAEPAQQIVAVLAPGVLGGTSKTRARPAALYKSSGFLVKGPSLARRPGVPGNFHTRATPRLDFLTRHECA